MGIKITLMVISKIGIVSPYKLFFDPDAVFLHGEVWRLITCPFYTGPIDKSNLLGTLMDFMFFRSIENSQFPRRKSQFAFVLIMISIVSMTICSFVHPFYVGYTLNQALTYILSKLHPDLMFSIIIFNVPARYMPIVHLVLGFIINGSIIVPLLGMITGHIVYYFLYLLQLITRKALFRVTPIFFRYLD